ncbi:serine/threonine protein kinase [Actinoalloteichus sp. AHMU CJ021]|uniref:phosphotransferase n=1 Tax=Actinoalloteichus TaxID=65496 RepID=UPI00047AFD46|nr:phosphotransferase [Actinoalloteichus caeruleus]AUS80319.1 serine/threonine protein kinase [Actinoalloteichus sp. AHMU CJ021]
MGIPVFLAAGRDADVFALDDRRVLRRYRAGTDAAPEAAVMAHLGKLGYPVPRVHRVDHADLVLERLDGPTLLQAVVDGLVSADDAGRELADLQARLHTLPPRVSTEPDWRIRHGDLHPGNVVLAARGPVVIDWRNTTEGPPGLDIALSAVILAQVAVDGGGALAGIARAVLPAFLAHSRRDALVALEEAVAARGADPNQGDAEIAHLGRAAALIRALSTDP